MRHPPKNWHIQDTLAVPPESGRETRDGGDVVDATAGPIRWMQNAESDATRSPKDRVIKNIGAIVGRERSKVDDMMRDAGRSAPATWTRNILQ